MVIRDPGRFRATRTFSLDLDMAVPARSQLAAGLVQGMHTRGEGDLLQGLKVFHVHRTSSSVLTCVTKKSIRSRLLKSDIEQTPGH